jgi:hypothetical protein
MPMKNGLTVSAMPSVNGAEWYRDVLPVLVFCMIGLSISMYGGAYLSTQFSQFLMG